MIALLGDPAPESTIIAVPQSPLLHTPDETHANDGSIPDAIEAALKAAASDPGALLEPPVLDAIRRLRRASAADYARIRANAKAAKCSVVELDRLTKPPRVTRNEARAQPNHAPVESRPVAVPRPTAPARPPCTESGAAILDDVHTYIGRFVAYPSEHARIAHALWIGHTHMMDAWDSTPRIAFLSPEPASGKSRALEVTEPLVPRPVEAVNVTPAYLFRKVGADGGRPTILYDEIDTVFGPKAKENEEIRGLLNAGHRKHSVAGRCVVRGKEVFTEEIPAYCAVALAGLGGLPDTILTRAVVVKMRRRAPTETVEPYRRRVNGPQGRKIAERLSEWAASNGPKVTWPAMPEGIEDRDADVWEALLMVADAAGGAWPQRAREAAVALVAESRQSTPSLGIQLLSDLRKIFGDHGVLSTESILTTLAAMTESPWGDIRGKPLDARGLSRRLQPYGIAPKNVRIGTATPKGYRCEDFHDNWVRYLPSPPEGSATSATSATTPPHVADVADVADLPGVEAHDSEIEEPEL